MALLEFLLATAGAGVVTADIFEFVANWLLMVAVWAMHVTMMMVMIVVVAAIRAMNVRLLGHAKLLRDEITRDYLAISHHVHVAAEQ